MSDKDTRNGKLDQLKKDVDTFAKKRKKELKRELAWLKTVEGKLPGSGKKGDKKLLALKELYTADLQVKDFLP